MRGFDRRRRAAAAQGVSAREALDRCDSYGFFWRGGLIVTGPDADERQRLSSNPDPVGEVFVTLALQLTSLNNSQMPTAG